MPVNEEALKKLTVKVNEGSGCIFRPSTKEFYYVLTVRHNVAQKGTEDKMDIINVSQQAPMPLDINVDPENVFLHPDLDVDLALIKINGTPPEVSVNYGIAQRKDQLRVYGFPDIMENRKNPIGSFLLTADISSNEMFEATGEPSFSTNEFSAAENIIGLSGSGIFDEESEIPLLKGIMPELTGAGGVYNKLNIYHIHMFDALIEHHSLLKLIPYQLLSFDTYHQKSFEAFPDVIQTLLIEKANELGKIFHPLVISENIKGKLFIPYSTSYASHLMQEKLWQGWLKILCFIWLCDENLLEVNEVIKLLSGDKEIHVRYFHTREKQMASIVEKILHDTYDQIEPNDNIIVSSDIYPLGRKHFSDIDLVGIVRDVCNANPVLRRKTEIDITSPSSVKSMSIIHLSCMEDALAEVRYETSNAQFEQSARKAILNYLKTKT